MLANHTVARLGEERPLARRLAWPAIVLFILVSVGTAGAAVPKIAKIEPPGWWAEPRMQPVELLLTGENLQGTHFVAPAAWKVAQAEVSGEGHYLFVLVEIPSDSRPGEVRLVLRSPEGEAAFGFTIYPPLPTEGDFQGFTSDDVLYLIMPDRFADGDPANDEPANAPGTYNRSLERAYHGGDLAGVIQHLPYLKKLGVTAIWLNPIYDNSNRRPQDYHGYGPVDFYAVDEHLGSLETFQKLVREAHRLGIKIIQDQVLNHSGPDHPWVRQPPTPTWFNGSAQKHIESPGDFLPLVDPHVLELRRQPTVRGWFANVLPDLDQDDAHVRRYLIQNSLWWVGVSGLDAIRLDAFPFVPRKFWQEWSNSMARVFPHITAIGEVFHRDPAITSFFQGGRKQWDAVDVGIQAVFDFPLYFTLRDVFLRETSMEWLVTVLRHDTLYPRPQSLVTFVGNHDVRRFMSERGATPEGLQLAETFLLTTRGIPQLYYGDEIGMQGGEDPDNRRDFPGGFPGDSRNAFEEKGRTATEQALFAHLQRLLRIRAAHPALRAGAHYHLLATSHAYAYLREAGSDRVVVALNSVDEPVTMEIPLAGTSLADGTLLEDALGSAGAVQVEARKVHARVPARGAVILVAR